MSSKKLARRYGLALVALGKEADALSSISQSLHDFSETLMLSESLLYRTLNNPAVSSDEKSAVIQELAKSLEMHAYATNTINILLDRGRLSIFSQLVTTFDEMADEELNRVRAKVTTASEISEVEKSTLRTTLSGAHGIPAENLIVDFQIDADIIGGLIAKVGDRTYDGSVRSQLKEIQNILK
jgi:F-type H+-transporting ATPase subunit delta